ncbi:MAG: DUF4350 domain-containing protein [Nitrospinota bacterium]|nr:DUF4350 domain-containing protein [Nitrospinota bacterium]
MKKAVAFTAAAIAAGVWLFFGLAEYTSRGGEGAPLYSVFRYDPYGAAGLMDYLKEKGVKTEAVIGPQLPDSTNATLIQVAEYRQNFNGSGARLSVKEVTQWVARGNTFIVFSRGGSPVGRKFGIFTRHTRFSKWVNGVEDDQRAGKPPNRAIGNGKLGDWTGADTDLSPEKKLFLHEPTVLKTQEDGRAKATVSTKDGPVAFETKHGMGRIIVVGDPSPVLNGWIAKGGNLEFAMGFLDDGPVYFDEWSHGVGYGGSIMGLIIIYGLAPAIFQIAFALALFLFSGRGEDIPDLPEEKETLSGVDQVRALGRLYSKSMKPDEARKRVMQELMLRAHEVLGFPPGEIREAALRAPEAKRIRAEKILAAADEISRGGTGINNKRLAGALADSSELSREKRNG